VTKSKENFGKDAEILRLRALGMSIRDIAASVDCPKSSVADIISRAKTSDTRTAWMDEFKEAIQRYRVPGTEDRYDFTAAWTDPSDPLYDPSNLAMLEEFYDALGIPQGPEHDHHAHTTSVVNGVRSVTCHEEGFDG
jgi:hypothetical protein